MPAGATAAHAEQERREAGYALNLPLSGTDGDVEAMAMHAGQGVGTIDTVEPAGAIVERFAAALRSA